MKRYLIAMNYQGVEHILHSDNKFYWNYINTPGCVYNVYKYRGFAERKIKAIQSMYKDLDFSIYIKEIECKPIK